LRQVCRENRKLVVGSLKQIHASKALRQLLLSKLLINKPATKQKIAVFLDNDGELPTQKLIQTLWKMGKQVYLPKIQPNQTLLFIKYTPSSKLLLNKYAIKEPASGQTLTADKLDIIFIPLTCFDSQGNRIGMGGGFYDKSLSFKNQRLFSNKQQPELIGWAHHCQQVKKITTQSWDIRLNWVFTEQKTFNFQRPL